MDAKDGFAAGGWDARYVPLNYHATQTFVEAQPSLVRLEHPEMQTANGTFDLQVLSGRPQKPFPNVLPPHLGKDMQIVHQTAPPRIEVSISADEADQSKIRVFGGSDQLCGRRAL